MFIRLVKYTVLMLFLVSEISAQNIFEFQNPFYTPESINNIQFLQNGTLGFAIGNYGLILKTTNYGINWSQQTINTKANLKKINIIDQSYCYVYGDSSGVYKSSNGGQNWVYINTVQNKISDLLFLNQSTGFVVTKNSIGRTINGGLNWLYFNPDPQSSTDYLSVYFINSQTGFLSAVNQTTNYAYIFKTTDSGLNWTNVNTTIDAFQISNLFFINAQTGWAAGTRFNNLFIIKTTNGGSGWFESTTSFPSFYPNNLFFENNNTGFVTSISKIIKTTNGGLNWATVLSGNGFNTSYFLNDTVYFLADSYSRIFLTNNSGIISDTLLGKENFLLNNVQSIDNNHAWCNGVNSANWKSSDGGSNWTFDVYSNSMKIKYSLFLDANTGYSVANRGSILKTTNFGNNWNLLLDYPNEIFYLTFLNAQTGWAFAGDSVFKTTNGGIVWISGRNEFNITKAKFFDELNGYGNNSNSLFRTTNSGINWNEISYNSVSDFTFINQSTGWTLGYSDTISVIKRTTNRGTSWTQLSSISDVIHTIKFINQTTGYIISYNRIYRTTDSGINWKYVSFPSSTSLRFFDMDFNDSNTGYVCGENSAILKVVNGNAIFVNNETSEFYDLKLYQNFPNPFNSQTRIKFLISNQSYVSVKIYDITGREVRSLINETLQPNLYSIDFDSSNLPSGIYFYTLKTNKKSVTKKLVVIK